MYKEVLVPVDNSEHSQWALERALEICHLSAGKITCNHVYAARLHDVRFRQLETGLPAQFQSEKELKRQRRIHDKLIEKGLQLISDSFLDHVERRCEAEGIAVRRQLLEGMNYEEIIHEVNSGTGTIPSLIGFNTKASARYDGGDRGRSDVQLDNDRRILGEDESEAEKLAGNTGRNYDLVVMGAHGIGRQRDSQIGGVVGRAARCIERDLLVVRDGAQFAGGKFMVCIDGSAYSYKTMRIALKLASQLKASLYVCSAFDVEYHHAVFNNIKGVLSAKASKVFKFEEQEELHNNIIDKGLLKLCQANLRRAEVLAAEYPDVELTTQILIGKPFQVALRWAEEIQPTLAVFGRHGSHRIENTPMGSQAENLLRMLPCSVLISGIDGVDLEDIPWLEEDGELGLDWAPEAEIRIQRVPPFAQGIARRAVEDYTVEHGAQTVTLAWLDEAIQKLLPTHMQLVMGIGDAEELARAEIKAEEQMSRTVVLGSEADAQESGREIEVRCPVTKQLSLRERTASDPTVWTLEAFDRLSVVPLIARPLARRTVERFAAGNGLWRITTQIMDENKQAMTDADEFDAQTMMGMFNELRARQIRAEAQGRDALSPEMRKFIEEAKANGVSRCPIRDVEAQMGACPVDFKSVSPAQAKAAMEEYLAKESDHGETS